MFGLATADREQMPSAATTALNQKSSKKQALKNGELKKATGKGLSSIDRMREGGGELNRI